MKYTREHIEAYQKEIEEYARNKYPHRRINFSIGEEFLEHKFPKQLPEEGLLVGKYGCLVYKLSDDSGYGFACGNQSDYHFNKLWGFSLDGHWKSATPEQEKKFIEMLKKECEKRGLFEDTKIEKHANGESLALPDYRGFNPGGNTTEVWNKNGRIFYKGNFATPRKKEETTLELVAKAVQEIEDFTIEQTKSGIIILNPIKK